MRLTQEGDYALRVVLYLYKCGMGRKVEAKVIAKSENVPQRFLLKMMRKLAASGIIKSYMGYGGGYAAEKPPEEVSVRAVIEAVEGPIIINKCLEDKSLCNAGRAETCEIHKALGEVQKKLISNFDSITFAKLLNNY